MTARYFSHSPRGFANEITISAVPAQLAEGHVNEQWHELLASIGLEAEGKPPVRMHDLRHSKGTVMANEGEDLVTEATLPWVLSVSARTTSRIRRGAPVSS